MTFVKDPVRAKDRAEVYRRDGGCIAPLVDRSAGPCRDGLSRVIDRTDPRGRTLDHVPPKAGSTRVSSPRWMVWLCRGHHAFPSYWETSHRQEERDYLAQKYGDLSMPLPTKEDIIRRISGQIETWDLVNERNLAEEILEKMTLEEHLLEAERLLMAATDDKGDEGLLREAHDMVSSALDRVEAWALTVAI